MAFKCATACVECRAPIVARHEAAALGQDLLSTIKRARMEKMLADVMYNLQRKEEKRGSKVPRRTSVLTMPAARYNSQARDGGQAQDGDDGAACDVGA